VLEAPDEGVARAGNGRPVGAVLAVTGVATVAFGVAAEPLLRVAERATALGG